MDMSYTSPTYSPSMCMHSFVCVVFDTIIQFNIKVCVYYVSTCQIMIMCMSEVWGVITIWKLVQLCRTYASASVVVML